MQPLKLYKIEHFENKILKSLATYSPWGRRKVRCDLATKQQQQNAECKKKKGKHAGRNPQHPCCLPSAPHTPSPSLSLSQLSPPPCLDGANKKLHGSWRYPCAESRGQPTLLSPNSKFLNCPSLSAMTSQDLSGRQSEPDRMTEGEFSVRQNQGLNAVLSFPFSRVSVTTSSFPIFYFPFITLRLLFLSSFSEHRAQVYLETVDLIRGSHRSLRQSIFECIYPVFSVSFAKKKNPTFSLFLSFFVPALALCCSH